MAKNRYENQAQEGEKFEEWNNETLVMVQKRRTQKRPNSRKQKEKAVKSLLQTRLPPRPLRHPIFSAIKLFLLQIIDIFRINCYLARSTILVSRELLTAGARLIYRTILVEVSAIHHVPSWHEQPQRACLGHARDVMRLLVGSRYAPGIHRSLEWDSQPCGFV